MKNVENIYPLSPMQQGILFHTLYAPESDVYLAQSVFTLQGELNIPALKLGWQQVLDRHAALRTSFLWDKLEQPLQVVHRQVVLPWIELDWREDLSSSQGEQLENWLRADRNRTFVLSKVPLMRLCLIRLADDHYNFICSHHHILMDGWSVRLVFDEVFSSYEALCQGQVFQFKARRPYSDYIAWLQQQDISAAERYWRGALKGVTTPTGLGTQPSSRLQEQGEDYADQRSFLSRNVTAALQSFARQHKLTLNTLMQGAWALLLARYSGEEDVIFGATGAGRPAELVGAESMVGLLINTLPVRVTVSAQDRVLPWLEKLQTSQVEQRQYEYCSLIAIQEWSEVPRGLPLFENILLFQNFPASYFNRSNNNSLLITWIRGIERTNYPLLITAAPGEELLLKINYDRLRLNDATVTRMLDHLETLLHGITENPASGVSELPLLTQGEQRQLLVDWNSTETEYSPACVQELFEQQVKRTPDAVAVVFEDQQLTYSELNIRANQLAHYLKKQGTGPEVLVGVCVERSIELLVGLFGILKAGGAYVPLDPAYPEERLRFVLDDAGVSILLIQKGLLKTIPQSDAKAICLDDDWDEISRESKDNPEPEVSGENLAYVIYTSGSTGKPKGVQISHRALTNFLQTMSGQPGIVPDDVLVSVTTLSFDIAGLELYLPLIVGSRVVLVSREVAADGLRLAETLQRSGATVMQATPATWRLLIEAGWQGNNQLKIFCGGEALSQELADELLKRSIALWNLYGPTETTIWSTACRIEAKDLNIPIGRPIANTQTYVLDSHLRLVPIGVPGDLYIGGDGVARGYLKRPDLTAERFVPNPFNSEVHSRLYKTGDLARYLPDGIIQYLGRLDKQVKLRGFRIELGEIESVLFQHPDIRDCAVCLREHEPGQKVLVGYIVAMQEHAPTVTELRGFLKKMLPEYMVPSVFVELLALPLTPNGKVDTRALPVPQNSRPDPAEGLVAPRTPVEEMIAETWAEVLKVSRIGIYDNFFELGGHSLVAIQVISRIRAAFHVDLSLRDLFDLQTVAALAERVTTLLGNSDVREMPDIQPVSRNEELPLSFTQQRLWFLHQLEPDSLGYNVLRGLRLKGALDTASLKQSFDAIVSRHEILRTTFPSDDGKPVQSIAPSYGVNLPVVDLSALSENGREETVDLLAMQEWRQPFDLSQGPLMRVSLLRINDEDHVLLLTIHHIINDGWSMGILFRELVTLYNALTAGKQPVLPHLPVQYADYAWWQRHFLREATRDRQLAYWRTQLFGTPEVIRLPTDRQRPPVRSFRGGSQSLTISKEITDGLKVLGRRDGATLFMTLLAVFKTLLWWYTGEDDVVVGSPNAGRSRAETEGLIGCFVNTMVLRTKLSGDNEIREVLRRVHETTLGALANQDVPFERIVEEIRPERSMSYNPLFQVWFVLQRTQQDPVAFQGLTLESLETKDSSARHDLQLTIWETNTGLKGAFTYSTDLFDAATVARMAQQFLTLLACVIADPHVRLRELRGTLDQADREYQARLAQSLEHTSRQKLKSIRRRSITAPEPKAAEELLDTASR